ncbi:MAG: hypothetical protein CMO80_04715 [Verrucomicrobiales bacterium]|nr:hypothetical protein [Verrucomicrobiales bacterium]|tara:strand:- start:4064 stop:5482 length:1419 start_codon:yes stop_codon:yes gene_type:complete
MNYTSYKDLPPLAGLTDFEGASKPGLSVAECVRRHKRYHYAFKRLHEIFTARLIAEPIYELKMAFSLHSHYCAEHAAALRARVGEMREPPLGLDATPHAALELLFDEIRNAPDTASLLLGLYEVALPALKQALEQHSSDTNPLVDAPSNRILKFARLEIDEMFTYGTIAIGQLVDSSDREVHQEWLALLNNALASAGNLNGTAPESADELTRLHSAKSNYDSKPARDDRFPDPYNMGVNAEVFLYDEAMPVKAKTLMMYYKRLREIDVPEMMASIIVETPGKPWNYYVDMTRQLWDEARHAMMGEVGFVNAGVDWPRHVMINFTWSLALNEQLTPMERHAVLYFIEQGLMPKTGKRYEWEVGKESGDPLSALFQDYDWADEVLHARIGRDWYVPNFDDSKQSIKYGDECWSKVLLNWSAWKENGHTEHRNWWPDCYRDACKTWKVEPDEKVLAFSETYEQVRADLKDLSASG